MNILKQGLLLIAAPLVFQALFLGVMIKGERDGSPEIPGTGPLELDEPVEPTNQDG